MAKQGRVRTVAAWTIYPLSWLAIYAFTDKARHLTLQNFITLFSDPDFLDPLLTTAIIATTSAVICCLVAAPIGWLVSRTDMPGRQTIRALVTASFVTPPFLGAVAWELLAAPNSGLLNQLYRYLTGAEDPLFDIYSLTGLIFVISCYTFPFVFVLVANALDNMPGALAYTDEKLDIVVCNDRFAEMYPVPRELLQRGAHYPHFLRYLAEHGYYGDGNVENAVIPLGAKGTFTQPHVKPDDLALLCSDVAQPMLGVKHQWFVFGIQKQHRAGRHITKRLNGVAEGFKPRHKIRITHAPMHLAGVVMLQ